MNPEILPSSRSPQLPMKAACTSPVTGWQTWHTNGVRRSICTMLPRSDIRLRRCAGHWRQLIPARQRLPTLRRHTSRWGWRVTWQLLDLGVDVVSLGELHVAQKAGFPPEKIHVHGNNKSAAELAAALDLKVQAIVVDNLDELKFLESLGAAARPARAHLATPHAGRECRYPCLPPDWPPRHQIWPADRGWAGGRSDPASASAAPG